MSAALPRFPDRTGPRQARREAARRHRRRQRVLLSAAALAIVTVAVAVWLGTRPGEGPPVQVRDGAAPGSAAGDQRSLLLVRAPDGGGPATGATLLAAGSEESPAAVVFVPVGTLLEIPGAGLDRLGRAHQFGGGVLARAGLENTLGIEVDEVATVTDAGLASLLARLDGFAVTVPERLVERDRDGSAVVRFEAGEQALDGPRLAELWGFRASDEDELATFPRQQQVLEALLGELHAGAAAVDVLLEGGPPELDTAAPTAWLAELFGALARARGEDRLTFALLPVEPFGAADRDGARSYRLHEERAAALIQERLAGMLPDEGAPAAVRIQVLNGVGTPGVGQEVDRRLQGGDFRIVLTENARSFDFDETQILVYDESRTTRDVAERVRQRLGVGTIQVSRQPQSVVDLTIVVGADLVADADDL